MSIFLHQAEKKGFFLFDRLDDGGGRHLESDARSHSIAARDFWLLRLIISTPCALCPCAALPRARQPGNQAHAGPHSSPTIPAPSIVTALIFFTSAWIGVICAAARMAAAMSAAVGPLLPDVLMPCA